MNVNKREFALLYYSKPNSEVAKKIGVKSVITVRNYAKMLGLKPKGTGYIYPNDKRLKVKVNFS